MKNSNLKKISIVTKLIFLITATRPQCISVILAVLSMTACKKEATVPGSLNSKVVSNYVIANSVVFDTLYSGEIKYDGTDRQVCFITEFAVKTDSVYGKEFKFFLKKSLGMEFIDARLYFDGYRVKRIEKADVINNVLDFNLYCPTLINPAYENTVGKHY